MTIISQCEIYFNDFLSGICKVDFIIEGIIIFQALYTIIVETLSLQLLRVNIRWKTAQGTNKHFKMAWLFAGIWSI